uniref:Putative serine protease 9 n=1 Tax=Reticulitermes speratus TaxID=60591 RepID=A0A1V1FNA8_9NEOP
MHTVLLALVLTLCLSSDGAWMHYTDSQNLDSSSIVFPSSYVSPFSTPERSHSSSDVRATYFHAIDAIFAVTVRVKALLVPEAKKNLLLSPFSTTTALAETLLGARGSSRSHILNILTPVNRTKGTAEATVAEFHQHMGGLIKVLKTSPVLDKSYQLHLASALFIDSLLKLSSDYQKAATELYGMEVMRLDFSGDPYSAVETINQWAAKHTMGTIKQVFSRPLPLTTAAILTNAIYFKGDWETPFNPEYTMPGKFKSSETRTVNVQFMRGQFDLKYVESKRYGCRMISIPYKHAEAEMYVILPDIGDLYEIHEFAATLSVEDIRELVSSTNLASVTLVMPKMRLAQTFSIRRLLSLLEQQIASEMQEKVLGSVPEQNKKQESGGIMCSGSNCTQHYHTLCKPRAQAEIPEHVSGEDVSGVSHEQNFEIGDIIQQVFVEVSEVGTEAAAVGTTLIDYFGDFKNFIVDRPFIFFIKHKITGSPLFWGTIVDPTNDDT